MGAALEAALREAVSSGRLHPSTRLPSSRALAADLGIGRNTIVDAYGQLVAEGWLTAVRGSGTKVADRAVAVEPPAPPTGGPQSSTLPRIRYDLRAGSPDLTDFPRTAWLAAARKALGSAPAEAFGYTDPRGRAELRGALTGYLSRARGVRANADRIVICTGFTQALALLSQVLTARGATTVAVEAHGHQHHRDIVAANGLGVSPVPVDAHGAVVTDFNDADAALLTPAHQFPLGVPLAPRRRTQAVEWAAARGALVIEDDYDGEFRYDRQAVGAMQALAPEAVAYAGTVSKTLAPGVRLGWLVLPAAMVDDVTSAKLLADRQTSSLEQLTFAALIESGAYDRHVRRCRLAYRLRRERLVAVLERQAPRLRITGVAAGLHALIQLPAHCSEDEIVARARERGLALEGLGGYRAGDDTIGPALVIGFGTPPAHAFTTAVARLGAVLAGLT